LRFFDFRDHYLARFRVEHRFSGAA